VNFEKLRMSSKGLGFVLSLFHNGRTQ
jgi:hypothetical protein